MAYTHPNPSSQEEACSKWQQANPHLPASDDNINTVTILAKRKLDVADHQDIGCSVSEAHCSQHNVEYIRVQELNVESFSKHSLLHNAPYSGPEPT